MSPYRSDAEGDGPDLRPVVAPRLRVGDRVYFEDPRLTGTVASVDDGAAVLVGEAAAVWVSLDQGGSLRMGAGRLTRIAGPRWGTWSWIRRVLGLA